MSASPHCKLGTFNYASGYELKNSIFTASSHCLSTHKSHKRKMKENLIFPCLLQLHTEGNKAAKLRKKTNLINTLNNGRATTRIPLP
jgi:hypothetical protein